MAEALTRDASRGGACGGYGGTQSPETRGDKQVALFQNGEVDYIVATDAIGMGLNLDVNHVAFADSTKFDGGACAVCCLPRWRRSPDARAGTSATALSARCRACRSMALRRNLPRKRSMRSRSIASQG